MTIRFLSDSAHNTAALTVTSEAMPIENTQGSRRAFVWRSTDTAEQTISGTPAAAATATGLVLARHNLSGAASIQLILKLGATTVYDTGTVGTGEIGAGDIIPAGTWRAGIDKYGATYNNLLEPQHLDLWFSAVTFDSYQIIVTDTGNADGFLQIGQIMLGEAFEPSVNMSYGLNLEWIEQTEHHRTDGGSLRSEGTHAAHRRLRIGLDWLNDADRSKLVTELFSAGKRADVYITAYPGDGGLLEIEHAFVARRMSDLGFTHPFFNNWKTQLIFEEA